MESCYRRGARKVPGVPQHDERENGGNWYEFARNGSNSRTVPPGAQWAPLRVHTVSMNFPFNPPHRRTHWGGGGKPPALRTIRNVLPFIVPRKQQFVWQFQSRGPGVVSQLPGFVTNWLRALPAYSIRFFILRILAFRWRRWRWRWSWRRNSRTIKTSSRIPTTAAGMRRAFRMA